MGLDARQRKANQRARQKGVPEPFGADYVAKVEAEQDVHAEMSRTREENHTFAQQYDASGKYYRSECRPLTTLLQVYEGGGLEIVDETDEQALLEKAKADKKKPLNLPIPSLHPVQIRATEHEGKHIDPNSKLHRKTFEDDGVLSFERWLHLRDKARKDLFWLGRLLGKGLFQKTHQVICDAFVQKNFDDLYFSECTFDDVHEMIGQQKRIAINSEPTGTLLLFAPRSGYKSTIDGLDAVQWMLNCPDIRIMIMTSVKDLSTQLMGEIKQYFYLPERGKATPFQLLFPEYVLMGVDGRSTQPVICPAQMFDSKEPHIWVTSLDSSFVGQRCDIRKLDDIVDDKNSADEELREKLKEKVKSTNALVEPWGMTDIIGTRYFTTDWYGWRMGQIADPDDPEDETEPFKYLCLSCWTPKKEFEIEYQRFLEEPNGVYQVREEMVDIWFPYKLNFKRLRTKLREYKERGFKNQYLNIATDPETLSDTVVHFDKETLRSHTYQLSAAPPSGELIVTVDWAYTNNRQSDFSSIAAIRRHTREDLTQELIVLEVKFNKWKSSDLALNIVLFLRHHKPQRTLIEKALGADLLELAIKAQAQHLGCPEVLNSIKFIPVDKTPSAKANRIKCLELLLQDDRLHFVSGSWLDEMYRQFERFTGDTKMGRKDDIPDGIAMAARTLPQNTFTHLKVNEEEERRREEEHEKELRKARHYEAYFGDRINTQKQGGNAQAPKLSQWRQGYQADVAPQPVAEPVVEEVKPQDPRMRIFGKNKAFRL